jgi:hypothetical protein
MSAMQAYKIVHSISSKLKQMDKSTLELLTKKTVNVAELKFLNINLLENLWQD